MSFRRQVISVFAVASVLLAYGLAAMAQETSAPVISDNPVVKTDWNERVPLSEDWAGPGLLLGLVPYFVSELLAIDARARIHDSRPNVISHARGFQVRLQKHWDGRGRLAATHSEFLRGLARTLIAHEDLFTVLLGPAFPGHHNHFHLDRAPYRVVEIF